MAGTELLLLAQLLQESGRSRKGVKGLKGQTENRLRPSKSQHVYVCEFH